MSNALAPRALLECGATAVDPGPSPSAGRRSDSSDARVADSRTARAERWACAHLHGRNGGPVTVRAWAPNVWGGSEPLLACRGSRPPLVGGGVFISVRSLQRTPHGPEAGGSRTNRCARRICPGADTVERLARAPPLHPLVRPGLHPCRPMRRCVHASFLSVSPRNRSGLSTEPLRTHRRTAIGHAASHPEPCDRSSRAHRVGNAVRTDFRPAGQRVVSEVSPTGPLVARAP